MSEFKPAEYEAKTIKTLVMTGLGYTSDEADAYIKECNGFKHPLRVLKRVKKALNMEDE